MTTEDLNLSIQTYLYNTSTTDTTVMGADRLERPTAFTELAVLVPPNNHINY
jgi:hypothetical protein